MADIDSIEKLQMIEGEKPCDVGVDTLVIHESDSSSSDSPTTDIPVDDGD